MSLHLPDYFQRNNFLYKNPEIPFHIMDNHSCKTTIIYVLHSQWYIHQSHFHRKTPVIPDNMEFPPGYRGKGWLPMHYSPPILQFHYNKYINHISSRRIREIKITLEFHPNLHRLFHTWQHQHLEFAAPDYLHPVILHPTEENLCKPASNPLHY